jgi:Sulfotransferase domain
LALDVIGAGFGRTGTLSLKLALEQIGFGPCYHMLEVFRRPGDSEKWEAAARGVPTNWASFLKDFRAAIDWPACHFWRELLDIFPNAKVILTERDPDKWYESISKTIFESMNAPPSDDPIRAAQQKMGRLIVSDLTFHNRSDKEHVLDVYRRHNEAVKRAIPASRLLVYDAPQGWKPLCDFLAVAVPDAPFPKTNSTEEFRTRAHIK